MPDSYSEIKFSEHKIVTKHTKKETANGKRGNFITDRTPHNPKHTQIMVVSRTFYTEYGRLILHPAQALG